jgi:superoxide dismutase
LGFGHISIHPEGNASSDPLKLHYVTQPKVLVKKLNDFIEESKKLINIPIAT